MIQINQVSIMLVIPQRIQHCSKEVLILSGAQTKQPHSPLEQKGQRKSEWESSQYHVTLIKYNNLNFSSHINKYSSSISNLWSITNALSEKQWNQKIKSKLHPLNRTLQHLKHCQMIKTNVLIAKVFLLVSSRVSSRVNTIKSKKWWACYPNSKSLQEEELNDSRWII